MSLPSALIEALRKGKANKLLATLYGSKPETIKKHVERYTNLLKTFIKRFGANRDVELFSTPGRTEVGGNHTDHNAGRILAAAVDLDVVAVASKNAENIIRVESEGYAGFSIQLDELYPVDEEKFTSPALTRGAACRLKELKYTIGGFDACVSGRVPKGSGLSSSAAFEVLSVTILNHFYNNGKINDILNAQVAQYAENVFFGKPCGLMDQTTAAVGGFVTIDFKNFSKPIVKKVKFDFSRSGYSLVIVDTGGNHADLNDDYTALEHEMKEVAHTFGGKVLREFTLQKVLANIDQLRKNVNDRAILRAIHFYGDDQRVVDQVKALETSNFKKFLQLVNDSGYSSWMLCQNCFANKYFKQQGIPLALTVSEHMLKGSGAWRVHGGGFAGTIQAFVPIKILPAYLTAMRKIFGDKSCHELLIRPVGTVKLEIPKN
jgi:galactokinase